MAKTSHIDEKRIQNEVARLKALLEEEKKKRSAVEEALAKTQEKSSSIVEAEKQFLANMSHEIRNPINAIVGLINLLYDTKLNTEQFEYLNNIKYSADVLMSLIADVLDLSKIQAGKLELNEKTIDLSEVVRAIIQTYSFKTHEQEIRFKIDFDEELQGHYRADPTVINQIFLNLIGNAVKFTEKGSIVIRGKIVEKEENLVTAQFDVTDTGIGIPEAQVSEIFEVFRQGQIENKLKYGGTGLGLSIVRKLVSLYRGDISVNSKEGVGSTFTFKLKLEQAETGYSEEVKKDNDVGTSPNLKRVLVVEDNKINQQYLTWLLGKWSIAYDVASNGQEALDLTEKNQYDMILMDIRMPVMDGYEATIRLRNRSLNQNHKVPIVALTASALVDEREKALDVGMNSHLPKPFSPDQLRRALNAFEHREKPEKNADRFQFSQDLNTEYLNRFYGTDIERAKLMFEIFLKNIDRQLEQLKEHQIQKELDAFAALAHKIKPSFAMVGLPELGDAIREIEALGDFNDYKNMEQQLNGFVDTFAEKKLLLIKELDNICNFLKK